MWRDYFKLIRIKPGRVITFLCGEVDFRKDNLSLEVLKKLWESDFPYLQITEFGKKELYGILEKQGDLESQVNSVKTEQPKMVKIGLLRTAGKRNTS